MSRRRGAQGPVASDAVIGVPRVDPGTRPTWSKRLLLPIVRSRAGRWLGIHLATRWDPWLARHTNGRVTLPLVLPVALLTTRGARSGRERTTPVLYFHDGDDVVLIASSWGRPSHPAWYHNLRAHPQALLAVGSAQGRYLAGEVDGPERERLWALACRVYPGYEDYRRRVPERRIPVLRLSPRPDGAA